VNFCCGLLTLNTFSSVLRHNPPSPNIDTHWGQQVFHLPSAIPLLADQTTRIQGTLEMMRTKESARLYNVRFRYTSSRRRTSSQDRDRDVLMKGKPEELVYQIP
jgi:hypothetical protein